MDRIAAATGATVSFRFDLVIIIIIIVINSLLSTPCKFPAVQPDNLKA